MITKRERKSFKIPEKRNYNHYPIVLNELQFYALKKFGCIIDDNKLDVPKLNGDRGLLNKIIDYINKNKIKWEQGSMVFE